ncbi:hypothetical protein EVAR_18260_1 [Eumeta japonica]|uniref:Histone-lysine N-methyltransferase SETMAR n=1 Tax=Eumeta variegata TaxID=151549 RepID=A0A4C1UJI5_EUMVA|nr:hypothetical protein EVAR_18260_1 [Eumeta japonica]
MSRNQPKWPSNEVPLKRMIPYFFNETGHLATVALVNCRTVNSNWNTAISLSKVIDELRNSNHKRILHYDNTSSRTAKQTNNFLKEQNVQLMRNPAHSSDLASCDFFIRKN